MTVVLKVVLFMQEYIVTTKKVLKKSNTTLLKHLAVYFQ